MLQVVVCVVLLPYFVLLVCDAHRISFLLVRNVHTSCGKGCAPVRVLEPPADWEAWVEVAVEFFLLFCNNSLSFLVIIQFFSRIHLSVRPRQPNFRQTVAANQAADLPSQDVNATFPHLLPSQAHH